MWIHFARGVIRAASLESCCRQAVDDFLNMCGIPGSHDDIGLCTFDEDVTAHTLMVSLDDVTAAVTELPCDPGTGHLVDPKFRL